MTLDDLMSSQHALHFAIAQYMRAQLLIMDYIQVMYFKHVDSLLATF